MSGYTTYSTPYQQGIPPPVATTPPPYSSAAYPAPYGSQTVYGGTAAVAPVGYSTNGYHPAPADESGVDLHTVVADCDIHVRMAFLRKVYMILSLQLGMTAGICGIFLSVDEVRTWVTDPANSWLVWFNFIPTIVCLIALMVMRRKSPANFILLFLFTLLESYTVGYIVCFYDSEIVLIAFIVTMVVFLTLTVFTIQTRIDFIGAGPYLMAGLIVLITMTFIGLFWYSEALDMAICSLGVVIFSFLIIYDTSLILKRLSPEEYISASISLYMDIINLFLYILRIFGRD